MKCDKIPNITTTKNIICNMNINLGERNCLNFIYATTRKRR